MLVPYIEGLFMYVCTYVPQKRDIAPKELTAHDFTLNFSVTSNYSLISFIVKDTELINLVIFRIV